MGLLASGIIIFGLGYILNRISLEKDIESSRYGYIGGERDGSITPQM